MSKHTPGPWVVDVFDDYEDGSNHEVLDSRGFPVATIEGSPILNRWDERFPDLRHWSDGIADGRTQINRAQDELIANSRLIAAAPELLEALRLARHHIQHAEHLVIVDAAISKAEATT